jgi:hypothetical protein
MISNGFLFILLAPGARLQLLGLGLLVCGIGLILTHLVIIGHRIEKLNELLPPQEQFDPALMRRQFWQFEKTFRAKFPNDKSLFLEIGCLVGGGLMEFTGLALLLPNIFK